MRGDLNEVQAQQLKDKFKQNFQGSNNAGDVIITPKKLSWVNFGLNAADISLLEQYNASIKDLCNIYSVPSVLLNNDKSSTYNNVKEAKKALYQNCVIPELIKIRDELNRWLTPQYGDKMYIDFDFSVIPELQEEMDKVVDQMSKAWWISPNEKRESMSYAQEENESLNDFYIPANLIPMSNNDIDIPLPQPIEEDEEEKNLEQIELQKEEVRGMIDVFTTQEEAEERARELGGEGFHTHDMDGETIYMPFETHEEYEDALKTWHEEEKNTNTYIQNLLHTKRMSNARKKVLDRYRKDYEKQLDIAERKINPQIQKYYQTEYFKGVDNFIQNGTTRLSIIISIWISKKHIYRNV